MTVLIQNAKTAITPESSYYTMEEALNELERRRSLKPIVEKYWKEELGMAPPIPSELKDRPFGELARHVATWRYENAVAAIMCERVGIPLLLSQYVGDKFHVGNNSKKTLVHGTMCYGEGKSGGFNTSLHEALSPVRSKKQRQLNLERLAGKSLSELETANNQNIVALHNQFQQQMYPEAFRNDCTQWYGHIGPNAAKYYGASLSVFVAHGILLEDYHGGESGHTLDSFTAKVYEPAWHYLYEKFGVPIIVVKLPWWKELGWYPGDEKWRSHGIIDLHSF